MGTLPCKMVLSKKRANQNVDLGGISGKLGRGYADDVY